MLLTAFLVVLSVVSYWAGFRAPAHPLQYESKFGFVALLGLALFSGYFAWREMSAIAELAKFIDPVPSITDVSYVPTSAEVLAISKFIAAVPVTGPLSASGADRQQLVKDAQNRRVEYWVLSTRLSRDSVVAFYREAAPRRGWSLETDASPWLSFSRDLDQLTLFVSDQSPRPGSKVLYAVTVTTGNQ